MFGMKQRAFIIEQFLHTLLVVRVFTTQYIPMEIFIIILILLEAAQYFKEGYTPKFMILFPLLSLQIFGEINQNLQMQYIASLLGGLLHFVPLKMYWLPEPKKIVGFREDTLQSDLHYMQFYPLDQDQQVQFRSLKWCYSKEIGKMLENKRISNHFLKKIGHMVLSYAEKHHLKVGVGSEQKTTQSIAFCHGRGATPFMYSSLLLHFAGENYKIGAVQHTDSVDPGLNSREEVKAFREKEVQVRAAELYQTIQKLDNDTIILMGHSYGCATIIQAYHSLEPSLKSKISHIILLDPWLFPLTESTLSKRIDTATLILANQDFIKNPDMFRRNNRFLELHKGDKVEYVVWKNAHHLHQTDLGFVNGNLLQACKNSHMSQIFFDLNIHAIDRFVRGEPVEGHYEGKDLGRAYTPEQFYNEGDFPL